MKISDASLDQIFHTARSANGFADKPVPAELLREVYDLPHEAIAVELGISESAAKVRLHRARRQLRDDAEVSRIVDDTDAASPGTRRWAS